MLVRISKHSLCQGMYVEAVECPDVEFNKKRFLLREKDDLDAIRLSSAVSVLINTTLGCAKQENKPTDSLSEAKEKLVESQIVATALMQGINDVYSVFDQLVAGKEFDLEKTRSVVRTLEEVATRSTSALIQMTRLRKKDTATYLHCLSVSTLMMRIGQLLRLKEQTILELGMAGLLHDIGKLFTPSQILVKTGSLTPEERRIIQSHPDVGYDILRSNGIDCELILEVCRNHHETLDGKGYPRALKAPEISLAVRIGTVSDVYDALTSTRPYKKPWTSKEALDWMYERNDQFDRKILHRLMEAVGG
ncbi:HD-GYP domain-containing protein [Rhizobium lemnae]|uniref:HD domain-containing phosphohydrolase n=1 Tax=Rhizobium lemnae TaxID=1214924 RepID=A0ABV8E418_9HYPH|nr:HD domain-containing phosphohydrolase [Rhizobium lemnae]MCJ8510639.1 HD-GYP domain-containing protein [Rhizobium lemnae]